MKMRRHFSTRDEVLSRPLLYANMDSAKAGFFVIDSQLCHEKKKSKNLINYRMGAID